MKKTPRARVVRGKTKVFKPSVAADLTDEKLVAGQLRALQRVVTAGFERMDVRFETIIEKVLVMVDDLANRMTSLEKRVSALEQKRPG